MKSVKKHAGLFSYDGKKIPYSYWSNLAENSVPDVVIFLGAGSVGSIPRMVAERAGPGVIVVEGIPHWHAGPNSENISEFSKSYFLSAYRSVLDAFRIDSVHILGESQAAPAPVLITISFPDTVQNIALIRPLGFTVSTFGDTPDTRMRSFRKRILRTYMQLSQSFLHDSRNLLVSLTVIRAMLSEPTIESLNNKYASGISYDLLDECKLASTIQHRKGNSFSLILGEKDKMFPPKEIIATLEASKIESLDIVTIPGDAHSSLAVRSSERALRTALHKVRSLISD